ncbi:MAG: beta-lactamase class D [Alteromonadaceae bacterium]|jgi:beta-lactamase class D
MKIHHRKTSILATVGFLLVSCTISTLSHAQDHVSERNDWGKYFNKYNAEGTVVILDNREDSHNTWVYNQERAKQRYSPASTFKIPHSLFALDAGIVKDEFQQFPWDGVKRGYEPHNQDQNLRSAVRNSAVWVYDIFAKEIGETKARGYLQKLAYGNANPYTETGSYWINGKLAISAHEQVRFLKRLHKNTLPFRLEHQLLIKDIMVVEASKNWILRAKTGWQGRYGWFVGWVEWPTGAVYFALNIDTPARMKDLYKREAIVREILASIQALPIIQK